MERTSMRRVRGGSPFYGRADPQRFMQRFLKWFCKPEYHYDIEGDLLEILRQTSRKQLGKSKADWYLFKDIIFLCRPGLYPVRNTSATTNQQRYVQKLSYYGVEKPLEKQALFIA